MLATSAPSPPTTVSFVPESVTEVAPPPAKNTSLAALDANWTVAAPRAETVSSLPVRKTRLLPVPADMLSLLPTAVRVSS